MALGADHGGFALKEALKTYLQELGYAVKVGENLAKQIVKTWLETEFTGGRHERRVNKIMAVEKRFLRK